MKTLSPILLVLFACAFVLCGCAVVSGVRVQSEAVEFVQPGVTTRADVIDNLGQPTVELANGTVFAYIWRTGYSMSGPEYNSEEWQRSVFEPGDGLTVQKGSTVSEKRKAFCVAFNQAGRVSKSEYITTSADESFEKAVLDWLNSNESNGSGK